MDQTRSPRGRNVHQVCSARAAPMVPTERIIRAVSNPYTTILGHMTGRLLLRRPGYDIDIEKVLAACAEHGVAVEINANPWRLDPDWRWHERR